jgi:hypothetical protein
MILLIFTAILTSCGYSGYSGKHSDLYSVAANSVLWLNGYSWGADYECDPSIEVIEEDSYGRTMFTYYEKHYKGSDISFSALIICQDSNEKEVFFYEDINYIIKEQKIYTQNTKNFTDDEIAYLKLINDWDKEINYDKCVRKDIAKAKQKLSSEKEIQNLIIDEFTLVNGEYSLFMDYLTSNIDDSKYIVYGYIRKTKQEGIYFIGLVENSDDIKLNILVPSNVYDYKDELIEFKKLNNWYLNI